MKTVATRILRATQAGETIFISIDDLASDDLDDHYRRDRSIPLTITEERVDIPFIDSEIHMWTSLSEYGETLAPHLHFNCPRCNRVHCTDLEDGDPNPRFAVCDSCLWESLVWLNWDENVAQKLKSEQGVAPQSATRSESDFGGGGTPQPESKPRPR